MRRKLMQTSENLQTVNASGKHYGPPPETFLQDAETMVKTLIEDAGDDPTLALYKLLFYMEHNGSTPQNADDLKQAKNKLEQIIASDLTC